MARNGFPDDLVQMQSDWIRTYEELARRSPWPARRRSGAA